MNKYQEALDRLNTIVENNGEGYVCRNYANSYNVAKEDVDTLQDCVDELSNYKSLDELLGCDVEKIALLLLVCKDRNYYFRYKDKVYSCNNVYVNNICWNDKDSMYISVSTNNEELKELEIYDVRLYAKDFGKTWFN